MNPKALIQAIRDDHRSGATALTHRAAEVFLAWVEEPGDQSLSEMARALVSAKPMMASIFNLANTILLQAEEAESFPEIVAQFTDSLKQTTRRIVDRGVELIEDGDVITTVSFSSTVFECLNRTTQFGKDFHVICLESRPRNEGVGLARELGKLGIAVTLIADALGPTEVQGADRAIVGGDTLTPEGLINKAGTYALALAAHTADVPFTVLLGAEKLLPVHNAARLIPEMDPTELLVEPAENVTVKNRYFDLTPLGLVSEIVTEQGVLTVREVRKELESIKIHETLQQVLAEDFSLS
ncbi:MAG: translation initiation factor eIF-2B [Candidatus Bipolaricaulia bacterium]